MAKFQLISRDEYGQTSILSSSESCEKMIEEGKKIVSGINVDNALTVDDKKKNWEAYMVEIGKDDSIIYAGKDNHGIDIAHKVGKKEIEVVSIGSLKSKLKIYLGHLDREDWYAVDNRGNEIDSLEHMDLEGKTAYCVRKI